MPTLQRVTIQNFYSQASSGAVSANLFRSFTSKNVSPDYKYTAFIDPKEQTLHVLELVSFRELNSTDDGKEVLAKSSVGLQEAESFMWASRHQNSVPYKIAVVQRPCSVVILELQRNTRNSRYLIAKCCGKLDKLTFAKITASDPNKLMSLEILEFTGRELYLLLNRRLVLGCYVTDTKSDISQELSICFPLDSLPVKHVQLVNNHIFVIKENIVYCYTLPTGQLFLELDLSTIIPYFRDEAICIDCFYISMSLNYILIRTSNNEFYLVNINASKGHDISSIETESSRKLVPSKLASVKSPISAFVKQIPSLTKENGTSHRSPFSIKEACLRMQFPSDFSVKNCTQILCFPKHIFCLFQDQNSSFEVIAFDAEDGTRCYHEKLLHPVILAAQRRDLSPPMMISECEMSIFVFDTSSEKLVNELMSYAGGSVAEIIAMLNQWKHITLDSALIEQGLKHRQLDTVRFFLKMKDDDFTLLWSLEVLNTYISDDQVTVWLEKVSDHMKEWNSIFNMLHSTVRVNIVNAASRHFAEQLAQVMLQTITHLLHCVHVGNKDIPCTTDIEIQVNNLAKDINQQLMKHIRELRSLLSNDVNGTKKADMVASNSSDKSIDSCAEFRKWNGMSAEAAIRQAICSQKIPLVQAWILRSERKSEFLKHQQGRSMLQAIQDVGMALVQECLEVRNINQAKAILFSMGFQADEKIKHLFRTTPDKDLRVVLAVELEKSKGLSVEEKQALEKMHLIEQLYPCSVFQKALKAIGPSRHGIRVVTQAASKYNPPDLHTSKEEDGDSNHEFVPSHASKYFQFILDWMKHVDDVCIERILIPGLWNENASWVRERVHPHTVWKYLLDYGSHSNLELWIRKCYSPFMDASISEFPYDWPIDSDMVKAVKDAPQHTANFVLDSLMRYGVVSEEEFGDIHSLLGRVGHMWNLLSNPPRLRFPSAPEDDFDVQGKVLNYLLENDLVNVLEMFVQDNRHIVKTTNTFLSMLLAFYEWGKQPDDPRLAFDAVLSMAQYLYSLPEKSVQCLLDQGHTKLALAALHVAPVQLCNVAVEDGSPSEKWGVRKDTLQDVVQQYPLLKHVFFPGDQNLIQDVTVYHLLQGGAPFDPSKLFGWQETNSLKNEDALHCFPHFSLPSLVDQYGLNTDITYTYYLLQGRPNFAFMKFMAGFLLKPKGQKQQQLDVYKDVMALAMKHVHNQSIIASCVVFLEMMGEDSLILRVHVKIAEIIATFYPQGFAQGQHILENLLILCQKKTEKGIVAARAVLDLLIKALEKKYESSARITHEECIEWRLVVKFCSVHGLPFPLHFLEKCAANNDWLMFFLHAQMYSYPRAQVLEAAKKFSNPFIAEQIKKVLESQLLVQFEDILHTKPAMGKRSKLAKGALQSKDLRTSLYARIGLKKSEKFSPTEAPKEKPSPPAPVDDDLVSLCSEDTHSLDNVPSESEGGDSQLMINKDKCSIFDLLLQCESSDSWRPLLQAAITLNNPLPAILAASFRNSLLIDCLGVYIFTLMSETSRKSAMKDMGVDSAPLSWNQTDFEILLQAAMKNREVKMLQLAFLFFNADSLLLELLDYFVAFLQEKNYDASVEKFKEFEDHAIQYVQRKKFEPKAKDAMFSDVKWVQKLVMLLLTSALLACETTYEKLALLRHYTFGDVQRIFSANVSVPDFKKLYQLVQSMKTIEVSVPIEQLIYPKDSPAYISAVHDIIGVLQNFGLYSEARSFAIEALISIDPVILNELNLKVRIQKQCASWHDISCRLQFWVSCNDAIKKSHIQALSAVEFFKGHKDCVISHEERCVLLMFILHWLEAVSSSKVPHKHIYEYEKEMWLAFIKAESMAHMDAPGGEPVNEVRSVTGNGLFWEIMLSSFEKDTHSYIDALSLDMLAIGYGDAVDADCIVLESEEEIQIVEKIMNKLLTKGLIWHAQKLAIYFSYENLELQIMMVSLKVALGQMTSKDIPPFIMTRFSSDGDAYRQGNLSFLTSPRLPSDSSSSGMSQPIVQSYYTVEQEQVLSLLGKLQSVGSYSSSFCNRILLHYRASCLRKESFEESIKENVFTVVKRLLKVESPEKYKLARELFAVHQISDDEIADFLCGEVLSNPLYFYSTEDLELGMGGEDGGDVTIYTPSNKSWHFMQVSKLCADPSLLGNKLLQMGMSDLDGRTRKELSLEVELCIRSHDCFYAACNMEGISRILKRARILTQALAQSEDYALMVRLVTGIGHFGEMTYIFDILVENDQFELLLGKNTEKVPQLKIALLEYLKTKRYSDTEMYSWVALSFRLFREIAENRESMAKQRISYLYPKKSGLKEELETALQEMSDAAERYVNADCLQRSQRCVQQAQLIALQIYLLASSNTWVLNLEEKAVANFISSHPIFLQSLVVAEAYKHHHSWSSALYCNVIEKGNWSYFEEFTQYLSLSEPLVQEIAQRYLQNVQKEKVDQQQTSNMQTLLGHIPNLETRYTLAKKLNFGTYTKLLLENENACYLYDMLFKEQI